MKLDPEIVKPYFRSRGTISRWWDPEAAGGSRFYRIHTRTREVVEEYVGRLRPRCPKVLDAGVGNGRVTAALAAKGLEVVGIDLSEEMLNMARDYVQKSCLQRGVQGSEIKVELVLMDIENLAFHDETFDVTVCLDTLTHVPNVKRGLQELIRVTKRGGSLLLTEPLTISYLLPYFGPRNLLHAKLMIYVVTVPLHYLALKRNPSRVDRMGFRLDELSSLVENGGCTILKNITFRGWWVPLKSMCIAKKL